MSCSAYRGTRAFLSVARELHGFDHSQAESVYHLARSKARAAKKDPTPQQWQDLVDKQLYALALNDNVDLNKYNRLDKFLRSVRDDTPPDAKTFAALRDLPLRMEKAKSALRRQIASAAAFRGADPEAVHERFLAYRDQYQTQFRGLPADQRPDPPAEWVEGYTTKDMMAVSSPRDRATLYAIYRCQADPTAFPTNPDQRYASIDLETAGPSGKDGMIPDNGSIIEVGIAEYDTTGARVSTYSQLVRPAPDVQAVCGTGAVAVHGITLNDVRDAPAWTDVAPHIAARLDGRIMMAQNAPFERDWLAHHMATENQPFAPYGPTVDTLTVARQHYSRLPNHRLETICTNVGVPYTNGHRALHDADVTAAAFFRMRDHIFTTWAATPARATAPHPPVGAGIRQPRSTPNVQRLSAQDFDPTTAEDQWTLIPQSTADAPHLPTDSPVGVDRAA